MSVRSMDMIGPRDVVYGQHWRYQLTQASRRDTYIVRGVTGDRVRLERIPDRAQKVVGFGVLLSEWVLVQEAEPLIRRGV